VAHRRPVDLPLVPGPDLDTGSRRRDRTGWLVRLPWRSRATMASRARRSCRCWPPNLYRRACRRPAGKLDPSSFSMRPTAFIANATFHRGEEFWSTAPARIRGPATRQKQCGFRFRCAHAYPSAWSTLRSLVWELLAIDFSIVLRGNVCKGTYAAEPCRPEGSVERLR